MSNEYTIITKADAASLRRQLQTATLRTNEAWWNQCKGLHQVYYSGIGEELVPVYQIWGYESWHDYVESELGIHVTTANGMVAVAHFFVVKMGDAFKPKHHLLSRQRMRALAAHSDKVTPASLNHWVTKARNMTVCQLEHDLDGRKEHTKSFSLQLSPSEYTTLKTALDELMKTGDYGSRKEALFAIITPRRKSA